MKNVDTNVMLEKIRSLVGTNKHDIYNSNLYWSQKPYNICDEIYSDYLEEGDVVMDPFMGSGVSIIEAVKKQYKLKPIGVEVNDYPIFLVRTLLAKYDILYVRQKIDDMIYQINQLNKYYEVECPDCGGIHVIDKCLFEFDEAGNKVLAKVCYKCPAAKETNHEPTEGDVIKFNLKTEDCKFFTNFDLLPDSRIAVREGEKIYDIFTSRNIVVIDKIIEIISKSEFSELFKYSLLGIMHLAKITDVKSSSQWPLWIPNRGCVEKNVVNLYMKALEKTYNAISSADYELMADRTEVSNYSELLNTSGGYYILKNGMQCITDEEIPAESVDLVLTDPPYMGQVIYSEYMQLYQPILHANIDYEKEIVIAKTKNRNKTEELYFSELGESFKQISRVLKTNSPFIMYFHDANLKIWDKLITILLESNLEFEGITHIEKKKSTLKNIVSPKKSMNGDALIFFRKRATIDDTVDRKITEEDEVAIKEICDKIISEEGGRATTADLYDNGVLAYMIHNGILKSYSKKHSDLTDMFAEWFEWSPEGVWLLRE